MRQTGEILNKILLPGGFKKFMFEWSRIFFFYNSQDHGTSASSLLVEMVFERNYDEIVRLSSSRMPPKAKNKLQL